MSELPQVEGIRSLPLLGFVSCRYSIGVSGDLDNVKFLCFLETSDIFAFLPNFKALL